MTKISCLPEFPEPKSQCPLERKKIPSLWPEKYKHMSVFMFFKMGKKKFAIEPNLDFEIKDICL